MELFSRQERDAGDEGHWDAWGNEVGFFEKAKVRHGVSS